MSRLVGIVLIVWWQAAGGTSAFSEDAIRRADADPAIAGNDPQILPISDSFGHSQRPSIACDAVGLDSGVWSPLDSLELFAGLEGSKQPQDFGVNAHFGGRLHANWGMPLVTDWGLGAQIGTSVNWTDHAVRVTSQIDGAGSRVQSFTTVGLFQRSSSGWLWGIAHDFLYQEDYDDFALSQWRGRLGYSLTERNEVGIQGRVPQEHDRGQWSVISVRLDPIAQGSFYWRHTWEHQAELTCWLGIADGHGEVNVALGDNTPTDERLAFGADLHIPLSDSWALFGEANFITPADTGTVDSYLGLAYYPGGTARGWRKRRFSPVLPVANNTSFAVDLSRQ